MKRQGSKGKGKGKNSPRPKSNKQKRPAQQQQQQPNVTAAAQSPSSETGTATGKLPIDKAVTDMAATAKLPIDKTPTGKAPTDKASTVKAPTGKALTEKALTEKSPAEKAPTEKTPKDQAPTEPAPPEKAQQRWSELQLEVPAQQEDMASWVLVKQCGALGCEVVPGKSGKVVIRASYEKSKLNENTVRSTIAILEEYGLSDTLRSLKVKDIPQEDWLAKWKEGFEPFRVGTKFLICPTWRHEGLSKSLSSGRIVILIEPGMAFGTGLHATTQFCLRALESYPPQGDVLDVGTGSGILAMAVKMMNPKARVIGVDTDPVAIETAKTDLDFNELVGCVDLRLGSTETVSDRQFDMILSNLTCEDIVALLPDYVRLLKSNGKVICAGILKEKMVLLETAIKRFPLNIEQSETFGNWVGVVLQR